MKFIISNKRNTAAVVLLLAVFLVIAPTHIAHGQRILQTLMDWTVQDLIYGIAIFPLSWLLARRGHAGKLYDAADSDYYQQHGADGLGHHPRFRQYVFYPHSAWYRAGLYFNGRVIRG